MIFYLKAEKDTDHVVAISKCVGTACGDKIQFHRLPLSRAGVSQAARAGHELFGEIKLGMVVCIMWLS
jgi:hypothetical protein